MLYPQNRDKIHWAFLLLSTLTRTFRNLPATLFGTFLSPRPSGVLCWHLPPKPFSLPPQTLIFFGKLARDQWPFLRHWPGTFSNLPRTNLEPCWKPFETLPRTFPEPGQSQALDSDWLSPDTILLGKIYSTWCTRKYRIGEQRQKPVIPKSCLQWRTHMPHSQRICGVAA